MSRDTRFGFLIDLRRCLGCHTCQISCKVENDVPLGVYRTWVKTVEKGTYPLARNYFLPIVCNQCEKPSCTSVCPVNATYSMENGIVYIDPHRCIGCGYCMAACPYGVRFLHPVRNVAEKCDWCWPRVRDGYGPPACVANCPGGVFVFGDIRDPKSEISRVLSRESVTVLKPETGNRPMAFYVGKDEMASRIVAATEGEEE